MSTLEANLELLSTIPEEHQKEIQQFLLMIFCDENPYIFIELFTNDHP